MFYVNKMTLHWQKMVPGENWSYARVVINQKKRKKESTTHSAHTVGQLGCFLLLLYAVIDIQHVQKPLHYVIYSLLLDRASLVLLI